MNNNDGRLVVTVVTIIAIVALAMCYIVMASV